MAGVLLLLQRSPQPRSCVRLRHCWRVGLTAAPHHVCPPSTPRLASVLSPARTSLKYSLIAPHLQLALSPSLPAINSSKTTAQHRHYSDSMASQLQKTTISDGNGQEFPSPGDTVTMHYTGWLYDDSKPDNKGEEFDSSLRRGEFVVPIGVGRVIKGWDEGVVQMSLNEKARLTIPGSMAYGPRGFPGKIPPNATLIFDVQLLKIQKRR